MSVLRKNASVRGLQVERAGVSMVLVSDEDL